jgi:HEAT repeat protein
VIDPNYLLSDEQMRHFLAYGYVKLKTQLPTSFHRSVYERTEEVFAKEGNPGNNLLPRVPQVHKVFDDPVIRGALASVLGHDYVMHSHRHPHISPAGGQGGGWHKDSYWGYRKVRCHRTRWAMIFYYPQDVTTENGPTGVIPGTHYYDTPVARDDESLHQMVCGEAGTATLVHFDLWHRAYPNTSDANRYMMKFQFTRMSEPDAPAWNGGQKAWQPLNNGLAPHDIMWSNLWDWHRGAAPTTQATTEATADILADTLDGEDPAARLKAADALGKLGPAAADAIPSLIKTLHDDHEPLRLNAAYALGAVGAAATAPLIDTLGDTIEHAGLDAAYALSAIGTPAVEALIAAVGDDNSARRAYAAYALGDIGPAAGSAAAEAVAGLAGDTDEVVRRNTAEALGTMQVASAKVVKALARLVNDEDGQAGYQAAYSLARLGAQAQAAVPALVQALDSDNRYVRNHSVEALRQIGTPQAQTALLDFLTTSRWCPLTSKESTF